MEYQAHSRYLLKTPSTVTDIPPTRTAGGKTAIMEGESIRRAGEIHHAPPFAILSRSIARRKRPGGNRRARRSPFGTGGNPPPCDCGGGPCPSLHPGQGKRLSRCHQSVRHRPPGGFGLRTAPGTTDEKNRRSDP